MADQDPAAAPQENRREHERIDADLRVRVNVDGTVIEGRTVNVSEGGVSMELPAAPLSAKGLLIAIELADLGWKEMRGDLRRSEPTDGGGVRLAARFAAAATEGDPASIRQFIDQYFEGAADRI